MPPLRRFAGRRNGASGRPCPTKEDPLQRGRARTPAPTTDVEAFLSFRRGRTLAGPLRGFCHSCPTLISLAYARHLLPMKGEGFWAADSRSYSPPEASRGAYHAPAVNTHRERWLGKARRGNRAAKPEIFVNPGPSGPEGIAKSHSNFARRKFLPIPRGNPRKWGPGAANMSAKRSS